MSEEDRKVDVPIDVANEQVILAAMAIDPIACDRILASLSDDAFLIEENREACVILREMRRRGLKYEPAAFARFSEGKVREDYLSQLIELQGKVSGNLAHHLEWLEWDRQKATMAMGPLADLLLALQKPREAPERTRALARMVADALAGDLGATRFLNDPHALVKAQMDKIDRRIAGEGATPFGIPGLDLFPGGEIDPNTKEDVGCTPRLIPGAAPGKVTVITALSGGGKTTLALRMALSLTRVQKRKGLYCAWEPNSGDVLEIISGMSLDWKRTNLMLGRDQNDLRSRMPSEQRVMLEERMHRVSKVVKTMRNPFAELPRAKGFPTNDRNLDVVAEHCAASGAEWVIFDLWERCLLATKPDDESAALKRMQGIAERNGQHFILLAQQRLGEVEQRADKRPTREGIKGSKSWIEVADTMLGVHRPGQWKRIADDILEVFVLKQRYGRWPLGISFDWDGNRGQISGGRSIEYDQPGEREGGGMFGDFVEPEATGRSKGRGRR